MQSTQTQSTKMQSTQMQSTQMQSAQTQSTKMQSTQMQSTQTQSTQMLATEVLSMSDQATPSDLSSISPSQTSATVAGSCDSKLCMHAVLFIIVKTL